MPDHTLPITFEIPTETILSDGKAIILNVGLVFALKESKRGLAAVPEICYARNLITNQKVPVPAITQFFGPMRILELIQSLLWISYYDDFDEDQKEYLDTYVLPFMND